MAPLIHENESFSPYQSNASSSKPLPRESAKSIPSSHTSRLELALSEAPATLQHVLKTDTDGGALCNGNSAGVDNTFKILQLAWALTTSCFTSANSLLFDWDSNSGISCLKALSTGQGSQFGDQLLIIEPDASLRQVLDKLATTQRRARECAKQTGNSDDEGSTDMFSTAFRYRNASASNSEINSEVDIFLDVTDARDGRLLAELVFSSQAIADPLALSVLHTFDHVLSSIRMSPDITVEEVNMCSPHDRQHITQLTSHVSESNERCLHDMFLEHSHTNPDVQAVVSWDGDLTYGELDDLTSRLSHRLVELGTVTQGLVPNIIELSKDGILSLPKKVEPACTTVRPTNACLILFTSGSTGEPKGIIQEHRTYATAVRDYARILGLDAGTRMYQFDDYAFDISNNDYLVPLSVGGCCCVPHPQKAIHVLKQHMNNLGANVSFLTPTVAIQLGPEDVPGLKTLCIGGEPPSNDLLSKWAGKVKLVNQYGMGEVATFCTYNDQMSPGSGTNVGRTGTGAAWVVSPASPERLMPVGAVGEMIMEGPHLARGYLDQISRKSEAGFLQYTPKWLHELHPERASSARLYRSGDLVNVYSKVELIKKTIGATLPEIQIPTLFLLVDRIPRTKSNKTDRRKLHMLGQNYYMPQREAPSGGAGEGNPKLAAGRVAPKEGPVPVSNSNGGMNGTKKRQVRELDGTDDLQPKRQKQVC
ncbi:predicted protein [Histoplasma mississippiense (nom. inval.)]|uniref:predicted protein n=1 Tax=Ajellomyces capsulatus (strain NAm1 / WU24) TaxID=2059318 RepID=UPI000157C8EB|nr:predicted protein [Histoplasma mississippiense (nom. inval.)]EDN09220.1 predicted protein [Histoplasma mississippiense (nom. inval.)]